MFANTVQPEIVSLFSSTSSGPLDLFGSACDALLPSDSFIHLLIDKSSLPAPPSPAVLILPPSQENSDVAEESDGTSGLCLSQRVLHIQSPTLRTTYIRCPPNNSQPLGLKHPWLHLQVRDVGREWSLEIGLVDRSGSVGVVRFSTFQVNITIMQPLFAKEPRLKRPTNPSSPPLLHLPISFPSISSRPLTSWATVTLHLPTFLPHFSSSSLLARGAESAHMPASSGSGMLSSSFSHTSYIKVYATCRLRRIWFSQGGPSKQAPWEFELYGDEYR
ncbi:Cilia-and flagella-associated protein 20 [Mycena sanguinolenta]|uniref:Cilia-and flagella-associated protein 20 n=1 Tax=Mycena sanguinolenta TaxID=230812 RepID=A0A8H7CX39_9AGAR|nr:Cilia-and flagella-associated protein 20 [Mycena sanguinolenta]